MSNELSTEPPQEWRQGI